MCHVRKGLESLACDMHDSAFDGITWAVSTTDSMLGPYVDIVGQNGTALPSGGEGVLNVAVNSSHSFSAWQLRNGSWVSPFYLCGPPQAHGIPGGVADSPLC